MNQPYGMPSSFMVGLHTSPSTYSENLNVIRPQFYHPGMSAPGSNPQQYFTNVFLVALRQQIEDCNHEIVYMLTQQISIVFNPLIQETHNSYIALSDQIGRIADFFATPPMRNTPAPQNQNPRLVEMPISGPNNGVKVRKTHEGGVELCKLFLLFKLSSMFRV